MRLGDLDALKEDLKQYFSDGTLDSVSAKLAFNMILRKIDNAPTVNIPNYGGQVVPDTLQGWRYEERPQGDLISRSEAEKLGATCLARRNENGQLEAIISLDNAPTVELDGYVLYGTGLELVSIDWLEEQLGKERPQGEKIKKEHYGWVYCSECDSLLGQQDNFCWNCGADMRGKNNGVNNT